MGTIGKRTGVVALATAFMTVMLSGIANATPDPVVEGFNTAEDKVVLYGGAMILLVLVGLGIALGVKYIGKGYRKA